MTVCTCSEIFLTWRKHERMSIVDDMFAGVDLLSRAVVRVREQFFLQMTREEAVANFAAREILLGCERQALDEIEIVFLRNR
jgi:hypothetical protein